MEPIGFTKVALPYGWLGNMSPYPIQFEGKEWRTSEALFQALRFSDPDIREEIRSQKSPMGAKFVAKKHKNKMNVIPLSDHDISNMEMCIILKLKFNPELKDLLLETQDRLIYEDVSSRMRGNNLYWGASIVNGEIVGENMLGKIWMKIRSGFNL
jgi:ribA/ribD-fused uncharacterized protein